MATNAIRALGSDPWASIRTLDLRQDAPPGEVWAAQGEGGPDVLRSTGGNWSVNADWNSPELAQYRSKYLNAEQMPDGTVRVIMQQPGAHKYDTMAAHYRQDPASGQWTLVGDPVATREKSSSRKNWETAGEMATTAALLTAGGYGVASAAGTAGGGAGLGTTTAAAPTTGASTTGALGGGGTTALGGGGTTALGGGGMGGFWGEIAGAMVSGAIQSNAASKAADAQRDATREGIGEQRRQYNQTRADFTPWREAGGRALGQLEGDISRMPTPEEVMSDPGYSFRQAEGEKALQRRIAAAGGRVSGPALKAIARYNQGFAAQEYGAAYQRRQDRLNRLAALAGIGQTATSNSAMAGQNATNAITGLISNQGDATAASRLYQGNIWGNTANQIGAYYGRGQQQQQPRSSFGTPGLDQFYYGNGTSGD